MTKETSLDFEIHNKARTITFPATDLTRDVVHKVLACDSYPVFTWFAKPKLIVDIGAHIGSFAVRMGMMFPEADIECYEPYGPSFELLKRNTLGLRVLAHNSAVAIEHTGKELHVPKNDNELVKASLYPIPEDCDIVKVNVTHPSMLPTNIDILKIDAEGVEPEIIAWLVATEEMKDISVVYLEFHKEVDRIYLEQMLLPTHRLAHARIYHTDGGELTYAKRV